MTFNQHITYLLDKNSKGEIIYIEELLSLAEQHNLTKDMVQVLIKATYHAARYEATLEELDTQKEIFDEIKKAIRP